MQAGISVAYDTNAMRIGERRLLREMARKAKADTVLIWFQIDTESAYARVRKRDRRKADDKYSPTLDSRTFDDIISRMQNPSATEDYVVISGKHTFATQKHAITKKLYNLGLLATDQATKVVKPGLVNLIPTHHAGRVDNTRRNIVIR